LQIFDSWAGVLPPAEFERWCVAPIAALAAKVRAKSPYARIIAFPRGAGTQLRKFARVAEIDAIGLDTSVEPRVAVAALPERFVLQGNLDPLALVAGGPRLDAEIERVRRGLETRAHIFNLGHGVLPETPIAHVERLIARVRRESEL
jgi:uroporphyrinogen decarboxylase